MPKKQMTPRFIHFYLVSLVAGSIVWLLIGGITGVEVAAVIFCIFMFVCVLANHLHNIDLFKERDPKVKKMTFKEFTKELLNKQNWKAYLKRNFESPRVWMNLVFFVIFIVTVILMVQGLNSLTAFWHASNSQVPPMTLAAFETLVIPIMLIMVPITPLFIWWFIFINFKVFGDDPMMLEARIRLLEQKLEAVSQAKTADSSKP